MPFVSSSLCEKVFLLSVYIDRKDHSEDTIRFVKIMISTFFCLNAVKDFVIISLAALYLRIRAFVFSAYYFKKRVYVFLYWSSSTSYCDLFLH